MFRKVVTIWSSVLTIVVLFGAFAMVSNHLREKQKAEQLGMTPSQYEEWRTDLKAKGYSQETITITTWLIPRVRDLCQRLPAGHPDRPHPVLCGR